MDKVWMALRLVAAAIAGYAVIVAITILGLELWLGGVTWAESSAATLLAGALVGVVAGLAGGYSAAWIARERPVIGAFAVWVFLLLDTTFVVTSGRFSDPTWFLLVGSVILLVATVVGGLWRRNRQAFAAVG